MSDPIVRFAPSPTGYIHLGNTRTALLNWCHVKRHGGHFILRYDDTDLERSRQEYAEAIAQDLAWLGINPDRVEWQSKRQPLYDAAAEKLRASGLLYACYETEDELDKKRRLARASHRPPIYDRAALKLTDAEKQAFEAQGIKPHWRFKLDGTTVAWEDGIRGHQTVETSSLSDPVMIRADGSCLYTFTSVVDDVDMGTTDIIRGEDHVTNTAVQMQLFQALGGTPPRFSHHNLLTTASGSGLSKREGSLSIRSLREGGYEPMAVACLAALVGSAEAVHPYKTMEELLNRVDIARLSRAPAQVGQDDLDGLNARLVHELTFDEAATRLVAAGVGGGEAFWLAVRGNLNFVHDAAQWWQVAHADTVDAAVSDEEKELLKTALELLPQEPWDGATWKAWTAAVAAASGKKGKALFHPLRIALTGQEKGPELAGFLPFIGRERAVKRLERAIS